MTYITEVFSMIRTSHGQKSRMPLNKECLSFVVVFFKAVQFENFSQSPSQQTNTKKGLLSSHVLVFNSRGGREDLPKILLWYSNYSPVWTQFSCQRRDSWRERLLRRKGWNKKIFLEKMRTNICKVINDEHANCCILNGFRR